jgi:flavin prenyltransferase
MFCGARRTGLRRRQLRGGAEVAAGPRGLRLAAVKRIFLGVTGASGAAYAATALRALTDAGCEVGLCVSRAGAHVISHELLAAGRGAPGDPDGVVREFVIRAGAAPGQVTILELDDLTASFASGSSLAPAALICPCSGSTLASIAHGVARNLIHRCADVMLKERRTLVLMTRETPLSLIHIENMATVTRAGAIVLPASPGFYANPTQVSQLVDFMVGKALDHLGVAHGLLARWGEDGDTVVPTDPTQARQ